MVNALHSRSEGSITARDIEIRTALLPDTHRAPRPRVVEADFFEGPIHWLPIPNGWVSWVTVGNVATYWEGADAANRPKSYYYTQHNAAAQVQLLGAFSPGSIEGAWQLTGQFGGVLAALDTQLFVPVPAQSARPWQEQPLVASRSWVMPEIVSGRCWLYYQKSPQQDPPELSVRLQWSLILTNPVS